MLFDTILGQDKALRIISVCLSQDTLKGSYLFYGPSGVGKATSALLLAKSLNCEDPSYASPCGKCASCNKIDKGLHPDVFFISRGQTDTQIKIEFIRDMLRKVSMRPFEGRWKVFIINEAEYLSEEAAAAMLKTLEEPPDNTVIILVSANPALMLPTVLSRCKKVAFNGLSPVLVTDIMVKKHGADRDTAEFIAFFCEGSLGDALELKDLSVLDAKNGIIDTFMFSKYQGKVVDMFDDEKKNLEFTMKVLISCLRDIWLLKIDSGLSLINNDRRHDLSRLKDKYSFEELDSLFKELGQLCSYASKNINKKLLSSYLELKMARSG